MVRRQHLVRVGLMLYTLVFLYAHRGIFTGKSCYLSAQHSQTLTDPASLATENKTGLAFIPACTTSVDELVAALPNSRWRLHIVCENRTRVTTTKENVSSDTPPFTISWDRGISCLRTFAERSCYKVKGQTVPDVVHYVWFGRNYFRPEHLISVLSAVRYQKPCAILFHADQLPYGDHWRLLLHLVPEVVHVSRSQPEAIYGYKFGFIQHKSDVVRLQTLISLGGIYLDGDQLITAPLTSVQQRHDLVMSHENRANLANSMLVARPGARFLQLWLASYTSYNSSRWGEHSTYVPWELAQRHPHLVHVVENRFVNPDLTDIGQVYYGDYDIRRNLGLHLYTRFLRKPLPLVGVAHWDSSLGRVWREILFGSPEKIVCSREGSP